MGEVRFGATGEDTPAGDEFLTRFSTPELSGHVCCCPADPPDNWLRRFEDERVPVPSLLDVFGPLSEPELEETPRPLADSPPWPPRIVFCAEES
jgi:hypothetical protein